jgi:hypothetical protein
MGLTWGRDDVHPGRVSPAAPMDVSRTGPGDSDLPSILLTNNRNDIRSVLLLAYSAPWNTATGDALSAPKDVKVWEEYVEAAVTKYAAAPYNIRYFQIWNEAAGRIISAPQSTFWHGPGYPSQEYARAMEDYVDLVHIPAARIIRQHRCMVVYGGWPDQGGIEQYEKWLDYHDLARWSDYLDIHYLGVAEMDRLYRRYVATGICRGVWQTEIGDTYCKDPRYLSRFWPAGRWSTGGTSPTSSRPWSTTGAAQRTSASRSGTTRPSTPLQAARSSPCALCWTARLPPIGPSPRSRTAVRLPQSGAEIASSFRSRSRNPAVAR